LLSVAGGQLTEADARTLILKKLYDLSLRELNRCLNDERRALTGAVENLWVKYAVSSHAIDASRAITVSTLNGFLRGLGYLP
jgi:type I restriction enzyme M protein